MSGVLLWGKCEWSLDWNVVASHHDRRQGRGDWLSSIGFLHGWGSREFPASAAWKSSTSRKRRSGTSLCAFLTVAPVVLVQSWLLPVDGLGLSSLFYPWESGTVVTALWEERLVCQYCCASRLLLGVGSRRHLLWMICGSMAVLRRPCQVISQRNFYVFCCIEQSAIEMILCFSTWGIFLCNFRVVIRQLQIYDDQWSRCNRRF